MKQSFVGFLFRGACWLWLLAFACLGFACKGSQSPGTTFGAPPLSDRTEAGVYRPYFATAEMNTPRYLHEAIRLKTGLIFVTGGSDERGFAALDTAELFDEVQVRKGERRPDTLTGTWIDTDFEGNQIVLEFQRFWHTTTLLPDDRVIVIGGASNWIQGRPIERIEVFDPETRIFETLKDAQMVIPRVRHSANFLPDGNVLISGGQIFDIFTLIQDVGNVQGGGFGGNVQLQIRISIFPSTEAAEVFNFRDLALTRLNEPDSTRPSNLSSSRGRAGHASVPLAGFDGVLSTEDDLLVLVGGFQTPKTGTIVPQVTISRPPSGTLTNMRNLEVFDPIAGLYLQIGTAFLLGSRVNDPQAANLGIFNDRSPDDQLGMGNVILVAQGDDNATACFNTTIQDEVFAATFTGFGPAFGLTINRISYPASAIENGHFPGIEAAVVIGSAFVPPVPTPEIPMTPFFPGRTMASMVALPRNVETRPGQLATSTWVYAGSGVHTWCSPAGLATYFDGTVASGVIFDPLYRLIPTADFTQSPRPNARDLTTTRDQNTNPMGVVGTYLAVDGKYPTTDRIGFADVPFPPNGTWGIVIAHRLMASLIATAGEDGVYDTVDDRVLHIGGGQEPDGSGGEPSAPSAEVFIMPLSR